MSFTAEQEERIREIAREEIDAYEARQKELRNERYEAAQQEMAEWYEAHPEQRPFMGL